MKKLFLFIVFSCFISQFASAQEDSYAQFFHAVAVNDAATVQSLLDRGFDPDAVDEQGNSALMVALRDGSAAVVKLLMRQDIDLEHRNAFDENALMLASLLGQLETVKTMVDAGAEVNKPGWTPLAYAASQGRLGVVRYLLDQSAYIDAAASNGSTPLMLAAYYGYPAVVDELLKQGADASLHNRLGFSAADLARKRGDARMAAQLEAAAGAVRPTEAPATTPGQP